MLRIDSCYCSNEEAKQQRNSSKNLINLHSQQDTLTPIIAMFSSNSCMMQLMITSTHKHISLTVIKPGKDKSSRWWLAKMLSWSERSQAYFTSNHPLFVKKLETMAPVPQIKLELEWQSQRIDINKARAEGLCFRCSKKGHMSCFCLDKKTQVRVMTMVEVKEKKQEDFHEI